MIETKLLGVAALAGAVLVFSGARAQACDCSGVSHRLVHPSPG